jgi:hypothetical protein
MPIKKKIMILQFLKEFSLLSKSEQRVFLYCVEHLPSPHMYSHDLRKIASATGLYYQSVRGALHAISASPILSTAVQYIRKDVNGPIMISLDALGEVGSRQRGEEQ